ncbi:multidrug efflux pump subunit AcrA (membrane-fusion protein) [Chitinophaga skermanii]|uniref:Multidrug efflux pump subunit AcrA (Membrane-fusion protein) n=1 Tax=Chitinophaga skermanii TaxID=331697 RepID=A0A327R2D2_9BACT|nr:HlyD family efflux transporter periplasmic adaptor subunit [Chitinophaga skermanii]RAJ10820.1 multidrug efflux pump subunit AcrA (membrane-fusion protein) [Chitinophaga skermanii]
MLKKKWWIFATATVVIAAASYFAFGRKASAVNTTVKVRKGNFRNVVSSPGELQAENTTYISAPSDLQSNDIYEEIKIQDMIPEGTIVKEGDYVATLDPAVVSKKISDFQTQLMTAQTTLSQTALDTALTLREARTNMQNLEFQAEQKKLAVELSKFEPKATIRQAEIDYEKSHRDIAEAESNYKIKVRQAEAKMQQAQTNLNRFQNIINDLESLRSRFRLMANKQGLLVYIPDRMTNGKKKAGSVVRSWDPRVAMVPDLSSMMSKTYINEVDISKIKKEQPVNMSLDAFPDVKLAGKIVSVASIGENRPGSNAKVFEVQIKLDKVDTILRPGMTTSNNILVNETPNQLIIPLEAVFAEKEISFVYLRDGNSVIKQEVKLGKANDEEVIVAKGIKEGDEIYLSEPVSSKEKAVKRL